MTNSPNRSVSLKGNGNGLRLIIPEGIDVDVAVKEARSIILEASSMVSQMEVIVDIGGRSLTESDLIYFLENLVWSGSLKVSQWKTDDILSRDLLSRSGFNLGESHAARSNLGYDTLVIHRSLRSGQIISHPGDVLVLGNVHDGSEVVASGNVCVFGRLSGVVHAGSDGDDGRFITADNFNARQIRIGSKVSNDVDLSDHPWWGRPVIVSVERGAFQITERK